MGSWRRHARLLLLEHLRQWNLETWLPEKVPNLAELGVLPLAQEHILAQEPVNGERAGAGKGATLISKRRF